MDTLYCKDFFSGRMKNFACVEFSNVQVSDSLRFVQSQLAILINEGNCPTKTFGINYAQNVLDFKKILFIPNTLLSRKE